MAGDFEWVDLGPSGLRATAIRLPRAEMGFLKHLYESWEGVAITRTVATLASTDEIVAAIVCTPDFEAQADAILIDHVQRSAADFGPEALPSSCREDWFLREWS